MLENTMTISERKLLEGCREIEILCKDLYTYFAELYDGNDEAVQLWQKTADEEQNHAEQFTLAIRLCRDLSCQVTVDPKLVESTILQMQSVIIKVKVNRPELKDALCSAIKLENYLADFHLGCVTCFKDNNYKKMFDAMMASDHEHIASLQTAYNKLV
jgi:rubrerythrin